MPTTAEFLNLPPNGAIILKNQNGDSLKFVQMIHSGGDLCVAYTVENGRVGHIPVSNGEVKYWLQGEVTIRGWFRYRRFLWEVIEDGLTRCNYR